VSCHQHKKFRRIIEIVQSRCLEFLSWAHLRPCAEPGSPFEPGAETALRTYFRSC
jgi:hypothetical protein